MKDTTAKVKKEKKQIPKKEKAFKIIWVIFTVIFVLMLLVRFLIPAMLKSQNPVVMKATANILVSMADESVEYKNMNGETHKYYIRVDNSKFKKAKKDKKNANTASIDNDSGITSGLIIEREEADGSRTAFNDPNFKMLDDETYGNEKIAVLIAFANTITTKFGLDLYKEYYSGKPQEEVLQLTDISRVTTNIFIFYTLFYIVLCILTYYQIWSRKYDEKLAQEQELKELNEEYQRGLTKEEASKPHKAKKLTKKQRRELNKQNKTVD